VCTPFSTPVSTPFVYVLFLNLLECDALSHGSAERFFKYIGIAVVTKTFNFVERREVFLVSPKEFGRGGAAIRDNPFVGKIHYCFLARFAEKALVDFSIFKVKTLDISFVGDKNMEVFYLVIGYSQLIVGDCSQELINLGQLALLLIHC
jgi:hypothetical protein